MNNSTSPHNFSLRQAKHFEQLSFERSSGTGAEDTCRWYSFFVPEEEMFPVSPWRGSDSSCRLAADTQFTGTEAKSTSVLKMFQHLPQVRSSLKIEPCLWIYTIYLLLQYQSSSGSVGKNIWLAFGRPRFKSCLDLIVFFPPIIALFHAAQVKLWPHFVFQVVDSF